MDKEGANSYSLAKIKESFVCWQKANSHSWAAILELSAQTESKYPLIAIQASKKCLQIVIYGKSFIHNGGTDSCSAGACWMWSALGQSSLPERSEEPASLGSLGHRECSIMNLQAPVCPPATVPQTKQEVFLFFLFFHTLLGMFTVISG